jgi:hypothetical protein
MGMVIQCRRVGRGMVSTGDGRAGGWWSSADGWADVWRAMHTDGPVDVQCRRVGRAMVGNADGWAGGWL